MQNLRRIVLLCKSGDNLEKCPLPKGFNQRLTLRCHGLLMQHSPFLALKAFDLKNSYLKDQHALVIMWVMMMPTSRQSLNYCLELYLTLTFCYS